jgi:hypothetical protein
MYPELGTGRFLTEPTCPAQRGMRVRTSLKFPFSASAISWRISGLQDHELWAP